MINIVLMLLLITVLSWATVTNTVIKCYLIVVNDESTVFNHQHVWIVV